MSLKHLKKVNHSKFKVFEFGVGPSGYRVCYYTNWAQYRPAGGTFFPENLDVTLCTHIMYAFAVIDTNNQIKAFEWNDETTSWSKGM